jgi:hypothetical protein
MSGRLYGYPLLDRCGLGRSLPAWSGRAAEPAGTVVLSIAPPGLRNADLSGLAIEPAIGDMPSTGSGRDTIVRTAWS